MKFRKIVSAAVAAVLLAVCAATAASSAGNEVHVFIDGRLYLGETILQPGTTYVSLRRFADEMPGARVGWDGETETANVTYRGVTLSARDGARMIEAGGRCLPCEQGIFTKDGRIYVPLRRIASAFGYSTRWVEGASLALLTKDENVLADGGDFYPGDDLYWLSRIISAEARGESFEGKLAVGTVIMNRKESDEYPDTVYGVIFDRNNGVQFTPTANGTVYQEPDEDSVRAAKLCLEGARTPGGILFFMNERIAESLWIKNNCTFVVSIGNHDFYA